jgi:hypothetical protein
MTLHKRPRSTSYDRHINEEDDREFRDFIDSVSVTQEELAALVRTPELSSIHEVREYLRVGTQNSPAKMTVPLALKEFQRRFQQSWGHVATAFVAAGAQYYQPRSPRKS